MKSHIGNLVAKALQQLAADGILDASAIKAPVIEHARDLAHGDFATNAAMVNAKAARMKPRDLAEKLVAALPQDELVSGVEIAGPGFVNFRLAETAHLMVVPRILAQGPEYGRSNLGQGSGCRWNSYPPTQPGHCTLGMAGGRLMARWWLICWPPWASMCIVNTM